MTDTTYGSDVLYRAASGLEKAWADVDADRLIDTNVEAIIDIWDPLRCPLRLLPFLAWAMGVTFWNNDWSETTKRQWLARQWEFKSLRGTEAGAAMALDFAGRDVSPFGYDLRGVIAQPQKIFSGPSLTKVERESWLQTLPQIRVYFYRNTPIAPTYQTFLGGWPAQQRNRRFFMEGRFIYPSAAKQHLERRAVYNVNGVDTDVKVTDFGNYFQLHLNGAEGNKVFSGRPFGVRHYIPSDAWRRLITIRPDTQTPWRIATGPSYDAITSQPEIIKVPGTRGLSVYIGSNFAHGTGSLMNNKNYFIPSTAKYRMFQRYAVFDGSVGLKRPNTQFMGTGRYGWPQFTAELDAHIPGKKSQFAAGEGIAVLKRRFWIPHDPKPMQYVRAALEASRRLSDKLLLRPVPLARFQAGRAFIAGVDKYVVGRPQV